MTRRFISTRTIEVTETGHLVEFLYDDGEQRDTLICAGHGGAVEPGTAELALELATAHEKTSCWATLGFEGEGSAFERWHPPSTKLKPAEYPLLGDVADRGFDRVLSLHGLGDDEVLVGGRIERERKERMATRLDDALSVPVRVSTNGKYSGTHPENFVNWLAGDGRGGLQLELGPTVRTEEISALRSALGTALTTWQ